MEVTQMVTNRTQHSEKKPVKQGPGSTYPEPHKIGASTPFDFSGKNLTPYGGLLPVATMLEKLGFQALVEATVKVTRQTKAMNGYQFLLAMVLGPVHRVQPSEPVALHRARSDPDGCTENRSVAAPEYAVAFSGGAARQRGAAAPFGAEPDAAPRMGSSQRKADRRNPGHGYDG